MLNTPNVHPVDLVAQSRAALIAGLYLPALTTAVTIPDVCAAINDPSGRTTGARYRTWLQTYTDPMYDSDEAAWLYQYRCAVLHEGRSVQGGEKTWDYVASNYGSSGGFHRTPIQWREKAEQPVVTFWMLDTRVLIEDLDRAVSGWLSQRQAIEHVALNLDRLLRARPDGIAQTGETLVY